MMTIWPQILGFFAPRYTRSNVSYIQPRLPRRTSWRSLCTLSNHICKYTIRENPKEELFLGICFSKGKGGSVESEIKLKKNTRASLLDK